MRRIALSMTILAVLGLAALPAGAQSREEREVRALLDRVIQATNSTDEKAALLVLDDLSRAGGPYVHPFAQVLRTNADVEANVKQRVAQVASIRYAATSPISVRVDKNLAWANYQWHAELKLKDGTQHSADGRATFAFVREGKGWKIAHWHSSIAAPAPLTSAARDAEAQKIIETERNAWEALKARKPEALADYFAEGASIFVEDSAYRLSGKANLDRALASFLQTTELRSYQMLDPQVQVLGDTAVLTYYFTESGAAAGKEFSSAGKITMVFVKQGGTWRALHEHRSVNR